MSTPPHGCWCCEEEIATRECLDLGADLCAECAANLETAGRLLAKIGATHLGPDYESTWYKKFTDGNEAA